MKSFLRVTLALACLIPLAACGKKQESKGFTAGIVFDVGGLGDKSFNDAAHRGLMRAKDELKIEVQYYEPKEEADRESGLRRYAAEKFSVIVGVGFMFTDEITVLAKDFPSLKFACVDMAVKGDPLPPNLVALKFKEEEGSFLVGALAGLLTKTNVVGFVGGMDVPLIHKFEAGFTAGVKHVNPGGQVLSGYSQSFKDAAKGKSLAVGMYEKRADIIYHASGQSGRGVFEAAREKDKLAIGVDSDQYEEAPGHVLTSMIKRVDLAVFETIKGVKDGKFEPGVKVFGLKEDGVGFVYDDRNKNLIPKEIYDKVMALRADIIAGRITVPSTR